MSVQRHKRIHLTINGQRTTLSVDAELANLLIIHLGEDPDSTDAHSLLSHWLRDNIRPIIGDVAGRNNASLWAKRLIIREIISTDLRKRYERWYLNQ